jgi:putative ABC transport system permease protein
MALMATFWLWARWSLRDLRRRWLVVTAIALIIAVGTGVYAGFTSTSVWTRQSYDESYAALNMYDVRVRLSPGSYAAAGSLHSAVETIPGAKQVAHVEERLIVPVQVDASTPARTILVPGELMGLDLGDGGPSVNALHVQQGRALTATDSGQNIAILRRSFALAHDLPPTGTLRLSGGAVMEYVGLGATPDYFVITARAAGFETVGNQPYYAGLMTSLPTAQALSGQGTVVNDLVLTLVPGADHAALRREVEAALAAHLPDVSATVLTTKEDEGHRLLYDDIDSSQRMIDIMAALILAGAALAAFNLTSRLVEAQRREIGVGMALGVWPVPLAIRPFLFAGQVAVFGVLAGIPVGLLVGEALKPLLQSGNSLPVWQTTFDVGTFARAAALGFVLPFLAAAYPILRAIRVQPIEAIRTGFLAAKSGGLAPLVSRIPLPGRSLAQLPVRNLVRTPRRTLLTALAIGGALTVFAGSRGLIDTFDDLVARQDAEATRAVPSRFEVQLDAFYPRDAERVRAIGSVPVVADTNHGLRVEGTAIAGAQQVEVVIDLLDFASAMWVPTIARGPAIQPPGSIVLAQKAAEDLGVEPGDTLTLRHPRREGTGYRLVETPVVVGGLHAGPFRYSAYMDLSQAGWFGLDGFTNLLQIRPTPGVSADAVQQALFGLPGIALAQPATAMTSQLRDVLAAFYDILRICMAAALALVLLVGFNATTIAADERAREHATMFAFGLPIGTVLRVNIVESALVGLLGAAIGIPVGFLMMKTVVERTLSPTYPQLSLQATFTLSTVLIAGAVGVLVVAVGPLFTRRRLRQMNIPATLRVVE